MDMVLSAVEARVLGALLEKERTVPATYPLTMKALISACNQTSSRDPIMDVGEAEVSAAVDALKAHKLVRKVLPSHGDRSVKFRQVAVEALAVDEAQRAVLTVLLLRGPQTPQELKTRTERLHGFADADAVGDVLEDMAGWGDPLVRLLPRRPGQRDARWAHLLSGEPDLSATSGPSGGSGLVGPSAAGGASRSVAPVAPPPPAAEAVHGPLGILAGSWVGADGERIEVVPRPGVPVLTWRTTGLGDDELGFLRIVGDDEVELVVADAGGGVATCTGLIGLGTDGVEVVLSTDATAAAPSAAPDSRSTTVDRTLRTTGAAFVVEVARTDPTGATDNRSVAFTRT